MVLYDARKATEKEEAGQYQQDRIGEKRGRKEKEQEGVQLRQDKRLKTNDGIHFRDHSFQPTEYTKQETGKTTKGIIYKQER